MKVKNKSRYYDAEKYIRGMEDGISIGVDLDLASKKEFPYIKVGDYEDYVFEGDWILTNDVGSKHVVSEDYFKSDYEEVGEISDGYHTFNELYLHRTILFAVICNQNYTRAWKSLKHADGTMFEGYFIAGIETPEGMYTYHYELKHWDLFNIPELDNAPEWDGHEAKDVDRLLSIIL